MSGGPYRLLFALALQHAYFTDGVCRPLAPRPSAQCLTLLERYGMRARAIAGGIEVYYPDGGDGAVDGFDATAPFTFTLENSDPYLMNYTDLDDGVGGVWYADNSSGQDEALALAWLTLMPRCFTYELAAPVALTSVSLLDNSGRAVVSGPPVALPTRMIELDLRELPDGRYTLLVNGGTALVFYLSDLPAGQAWGAIALYATGGKVNAKRYRLALGSRKTTWRYVVVSPATPAPDYGRYSIAGQFSAAGQGDIGFDPPVLLEVNGLPAAQFSCTEALPFYERPGQRMRIDLHSSGDGVSGASSSPLPYAQRDVLVVDKVSDIYVYL